MNPTAILTADWHIRDTIPSCRKDDFIKAQWDKVEFIFDKARGYNCPILISGDLGDKPEWKNETLSTFISLVNKYQVEIFVVPGQHDLPNHNKNLFFKSGLNTLKKAKVIKIMRSISYSSDSMQQSITGYWYGENPYKFASFFNPSKTNILVMHKMVITHKDLYPGQNADSAISIIKKYPNYDLIVTGDNHQSFSNYYEGRLLVNCGSILRDDIGQKDFKPCVWLWYLESNSVEQAFLPIEKNVFKEKSESKIINANLNSYVEKLQKEYAQGMSFQKNLESFLKQHKVEKDICNKIWKSLGDIK